MITIKAQIIAGLLLVGNLSGAQVEFGWDLHPNFDRTRGQRIDVTAIGGERYVSVLATVGQTNISISIPPGHYSATLVTVGDTEWSTNELTGEVSTRDLVVGSVSEPVQILVLPSPKLQVLVQSSSGLSDTWSDVGVAVSYDLREVEGKYFRAVMVQAPAEVPPLPPPPPPLPPPTNVVVSFLPTDDAYLQGSTRFNDNHLKVEAGNRVSYLKFNVSGLSGTVRSATLRLQEAGDPGAGTLRVYRGSHNNWTEATLSTSTRPLEHAQVGTFTGTVAPTQVVNIDVTPLVTGSGTYTVIVKMDAGGNDVWFGSNESTRKPELIVETKAP